jgi:glycosyltransferase involved in cell wall biosynthesis
MARVLFAHQNFPGQFKHVCRHLADAGHDVAFLTRKNTNRMIGVRKVEYDWSRQPTDGIHPWAAHFETSMLYAEGAVRAASALKRAGWAPDLMVGHTGWGETLFLKDVFPGVPLLGYFEWYFGPSPAGFDPEFPGRADAPAFLRARNAVADMALQSADHGLSPTRYQHGLHPAIWQSKISVIHDGVSCSALDPARYADPTLTIASTGRPERVFRKGQPVITFVSRALEPVRGFDKFMRAIPHVLAALPDAHVIVVGNSKSASYGDNPPNGQTWLERMLGEVAFDRARVTFCDRVDRETLNHLFAVSAAHVYLTAPWVLSWSLIEALSMGCLVVSSRTKPVEEVLVHGHNAVLVDFFDVEALAAAIVDAVRRPDEHASLRAAARATALERYDLDTVTLPAQLALLGRLQPKLRVARPSLEVGVADQALGSAERRTTDPSREGPDGIARRDPIPHTAAAAAA